MIKFTLFILLSLPTISFAASTGTSYIGGGLTFYNFYNTTANKDASKSMIGDYFIPFQYTKFFTAFNNTAGFRLSYTPIPRSVGDGAADSTLLQVSYNNFVNTASGGSDWSYGLGYVMHTLKGKNGTVILNNGTGTSTFYRPSETSTTGIFLLETGYHVDSGESRYSMELFFSQLLSSRRSYTIKLTYNYKLGSGF